MGWRPIESVDYNHNVECSFNKIESMCYYMGTCAIWAVWPMLLTFLMGQSAASVRQKQHWSSIGSNCGVGLKPRRQWNQPPPPPPALLEPTRIADRFHIAYLPAKETPFHCEHRFMSIPFPVWFLEKALKKKPKSDWRKKHVCIAQAEESLLPET